MNEILEQAKANLQIAQKAMTTAANRKRQAVTFNVGDSVWLSSKNLRTNRPSKKLDDKMIRPFQVIDKYGSSYVLDLPNTMDIHRTFHVVRVNLEQIIRA